MSLVPLKSFLAQAFNRLDKNNTLKEKQENQALETAFLRFFPRSTDASVHYKNGTLTVRTNSSSMKQKTILLQEQIIRHMKETNQDITIRRIIFKNLPQ